MTGVTTGRIASVFGKACVQIPNKTACTQQLAPKIEVFALQTALLFRAWLWYGKQSVTIDLIGYLN